MKFEKWHLSITIVCLLFGILFTANLKTQMQVYNPMAARNKTLVNVIETQEQKNQELEAEIAGTRKKIEEYQAKANQSNQNPTKLELEKAKVKAGLIPVKGPGVIITLNDQIRSQTLRDPNFYLIHYSSILFIVNELRSAGAEAISVNEERVVGISDIRCAGTIILVNTNRLAPPYKIKAIGNPEILETAVINGEFSSLELSKFPVTLEKSQNLTIDAYTGSYTFNYAAPLKKVGE